MIPLLQWTGRLEEYEKVQFFGSFRGSGRLSADNLLKYSIFYGSLGSFQWVLCV